MEITRDAASRATRFTIAIVEADQATGDALAAWVREMGHHAVRFGAWTDLLSAVRRTEFSLFLLDGGLADIVGIDFVRKLRACGPIDAPIILCTVGGGEADVVEALRLGADDLIAKPVRRRELAACIGAALRHAYPRPLDSAFLSVPPYSIDLVNRVFHVDGEVIELQDREFALALVLFRNLNGVMPRARIIQSVWGSEPPEASRTLDSHISHIRRKLGLAAGRGLILQSVYGIGYRLQVVAMPPLEES